MATRHLVKAGAVIALLATASANAADIPSAQPYRAPATVPVPAFTWTGFYAGLNAGYGFGKISDVTGTSSDSMSGAIAGGQIGGQIQSGAFVFGVEGDFQGSWQDKSYVSGALTVKEEIPWFGTVRGRVGMAFDRSLLYVTAGGAYTNFKLSGTALGVTVSSSASHAAWTVGAGWEYMFVERWSSKIEYLYIDTGNINTTLFAVPVSGRLTDNIVRAGINYHF
jgi:outer membrane immunogenic protein